MYNLLLKNNLLLQCEIIVLFKLQFARLTDKPYKPAAYVRTRILIFWFVTSIHILKFTY